MARAHQQHGRKQMIQPVLPLLTPLAKSNKEQTKLKEVLDCRDNDTSEDPGSRTDDYSVLNVNTVVGTDTVQNEPLYRSSQDDQNTGNQPLTENPVETVKHENQTAVDLKDLDTTGNSAEQLKNILKKEATTEESQVQSIMQTSAGTHSRADEDIPAVPVQPYEHNINGNIPDTGLIEISPASSPSAPAGPVELSAQPTPTVPAITAVSPEVQLPMRQQSQANGRKDPPAELLTNGHVAQAYLSGLHFPHASLNSSARATPLPGILDHLLHLANSKHWADWAIEVNQPVPNMQPYVAYAHSLVLIRSDRMRKKMTRPQEGPFQPNLLSFYPARTIQPHAFEAALRFLYSDTVLSNEALFPRDTYMDKYAKAHIVDYVLSYWMAGIELAIEPVTSRAFTLLAGLTEWDMAELLVKEATSLRALSPVIREHEAPPESLVMADSIIRLVFGLFTHQLDLSHFKLDTDAQSTTMIGRFSQFEFGRPSSNPALAGMVFGSMPSSGTLSPITPTGASVQVADHVASNILVNLDFADLCILCRDMVNVHGDAGLSLLADAVEEREKRRLAIVNSRTIANKQRMANSTMWETLAFREFLADGKVQRERVGYLLPQQKR